MAQITMSTTDQSTTETTMATDRLTKITLTVRTMMLMATDEDWWGGNSEPETKFIQDLTEMNDDTGDGASEFKSTLTHHSYLN